MTTGMTPRNIMLRAVQGLGIAAATLILGALVVIMYHQWFETVVTGLINMGNMNYMR